MSLGVRGIRKILTPAEERAAWEAGDLNALVESIWPFVTRTARRIAREEEAVYDELISAAHLSIVRSLESFNPDMGRFITYSCKFMRAKMLRARTAYYRNAVGQVEEQFASFLMANDEDDDSRLPDFETVLGKARNICRASEVETLVGVSKGMTFKEMAEAAGCSKQNMHQRYQRAVAKCGAVLRAEVGLS